jgi:hypothetical protein
MSAQLVFDPYSRCEIFVLALLDSRNRLAI